MDRDFELEQAKLKLLDAEALADAVEEMIVRGVLNARSLAGDALLDYRDPSADTCERCGELPAAVRVAAGHVCVACFAGRRSHLRRRRSDRPQTLAGRGEDPTA